jgi:hypothetical protein
MLVPLLAEALSGVRAEKLSVSWTKPTVGVALLICIETPPKEIAAIIGVAPC